MDKRLLRIVIFSLITGVIWIGFEVYVRLNSDTIQINYQNYLEYVTGEFDTETIDDLVAREEEYMMIERGDLD